MGDADLDKRYQVFVSSTFEDLQDERKEVMQALLELDCIPCGMELFPASNEDQWSLIKRVIDDCDYYILIIGGRYGSTNDKGIGFTEMEYRYAVDSGKPVIAFLHKHPEQIPSGKTEQNAEGKTKLEAFKALAQEKMTKFWTNPDDLGSVVSRSMIKLIKQFPTIGWIKADNVTDEKSIIEILRLQKENEELKKNVSEIITKAPEGVNELQQGNDQNILQLNFHGMRKNGYEYDYYNSIACEFSWNEIFKALSPHLINESSETNMEKVLSDYFASKSTETVSVIRKEDKLDKVAYPSIEDSDFQKIKVQLKALGLITQSKKNRSVKDTLNYWTLTPYGDFVMTQLIAIKKEISVD
jgi:hypothetical protein